MGLYVGTIMGLAYGTVYGVAYGLYQASIQTLFCGVLGKLDREIRPAEVVVWSWTSTKQRLIGFAVGGLLIGLALGLIFLPDLGLISAMLLGLIFGLTLGLLGAIVGGLSHHVLNQHDLTTPNQGIRRSARHSIFLGVSCGCTSGLLIGLIFSPLVGPIDGALYGLIAGITIGEVIGLRTGGIACIQHLILRFLLRHLGYIPWHYAKFLDYATERILLRKVGGGYIFTHRLLLDYLATCDSPSGEASGSSTN
jgi:hypothetical protein